MSRSNLSLLIQVVTGQNNLNYLTHKINPNYTDLCRFCEEEEETFIHIVNECPVFYSRQMELFEGKPIINSIEWKPKTLLKFAKDSAIFEALTDNTEKYKI